ncbi:MAG: hypothetical protein M3R04_10200 [bacterium]|nr:hypothetical protein [bacterium]
MTHPTATNAAGVIGEAFGAPNAYSGLFKGGRGVRIENGLRVVTGNVGIGTASPAHSLDVVGTINASGFLINGAPFGGGGSQWMTSGTNLFFNTGNVGIGTGSTGPNEALSVYKAMGGWQARLANGSGAGGAEVYLSHGGGYGMHIRGWNAADAVYTLELHNITAQTNVFYNSGRAALGLVGNVSIGTAAPSSAKLHVQGNGTVSGNWTVDGNIAAKYQDVAEWVPSRQLLSAATVVVLDPSHTNHVLASATPYDLRVAGVVSAQPGISLGERGEGKLLIATTGRVRIKVDATRAPIMIGDLLVTSGIEGFAMRSDPLDFHGVRLHRPGTIIGKALEPLAKGTGEILVLLSLQ